MRTTIDRPVDETALSPTDFALGVERVTTLFVNAYLVGQPGSPWALVDTGLPGFAKLVRRAADRRFGRGRRPEAIILTHGHFDHAGSAAVLADRWNVPVYAHPLELPYLTGRSLYPPADSTVGGALGVMSRMFPRRRVDLGTRVRPLPDDGSLPGMPGWIWVHTPGHTPGHISLFREVDRLLLTGDAMATLDQDSAMEMFAKNPRLSVPPAPLTADWRSARESVRKLAILEPWALAAGHGLALRGSRIADDLKVFAEIFTAPRGGRYVAQPAEADETGVVYLPPPIPDPFPARLMLAGIAVGALYGLSRGRQGGRR